MDKKVSTQIFEKSKKLLEEKNFKDAEKELKKIAQKFPENWEIFYLLAYSLFKQEKYKESLKKVNISLTLKPLDSTTHHLAGYCCFNLEDYKKAEEHLLRALELNYDNSHVHYLLGHIYARTGERKKSLTEFYTSLSKGIEFPDIYEELARIHFENGEFEDAKRNFLILLQLKPEEPVIYYMSGRCFLNLSDYQEAIKFFKKAIHLGLSDANLLKARHLLALCYCGNKRFNSAEKVMRNALIEEPEYYDYYYLLGKILLSRMDYRRARAVFEKIIELNLSPQEEALYHIAFTYIIEDKIHIAIDKLEEISARWNRHLKTHYTLGTLYYHMNEKEKAIDHWKKCVEIDPEGLGKKALGKIGIGES